MISTTTTEEHCPPSPSDAERAEPVLLAVFPSLGVLPLPPSGEIIGRNEFAKAGVVDKEISGKHLRFSRPGGNHYVEDLGSRNGTFLNGHWIGKNAPTPLADGAILRIGRTLLVFRASFGGSYLPDKPLGSLISPFGLRGARQDIERITAQKARNVLIQGETGTGKELLAAYLHAALGRADKPFAPVNVAAVPASLFESHLFGWRKGAFSGGAEGGEGILRAHHRGTVFLDEIGELPLDLQPKLLRLLESREVWPVGEARPTREVDLLLLAATNRLLDEMVEAGTFRRDLYARFVARVEIPPLRERPEDIFAILESLFLRRGARLDAKRIEVEALERLLLFPWKSNVRELDLLVTHIEAEGGVTLSAVSEVLGPGAENLGKRPLTRELVNRVLSECKGNQQEAARRLGVDRGKLLRLLKKVAEGGSPQKA